MSKFLLIGSVAAMLYGDCAWGMFGGFGESVQDISSERNNANSEVRSRRNSKGKVSYQDAQTQTEQSQFEQSWSGQTQANPQQLQENRFIKIEFEGVKGYADALTGAVLNNTYMQYHYVPSNNSKIGHATPTTVVTVTRDDLRCWNDISEIRYANDVSYDKLENPKVILYRNKDNSCYIILRTDDGKKYGVFYGLNERNVEIGRQSFAVYEVSEDVGSFTDGVERLIYVDESGLYFVPKAENSVENVIDTYQKEGRFKFDGSIVKVSAIDGSITLDGEPVTEDNFFDNWVLEKNKTVLSTKQSGEKEVLRNFYPPNGRYNGIYFQKVKNERGEYRTESINSYREGISWLNSFVNKRLSQTKATNENGAEELVRDGTFASILSLPNERFISFSSKFGSDPGYYQKVCDAVATQVVAAKQTQTGGAGTFVFGASSSITSQSIQTQTGGGTFVFGSSNSTTSQSIPGMILQNPTLFKNPDFVRKLKPAFEGVEKDYEESRIAGSELWLPFEIVRNL